MKGRLPAGPENTRATLTVTVLAALVLCIAAEAPSAAAQTSPVIAAAGDIACDPASGFYNGGLGTATDCRQRYTSDLLLDGDLARVLALGDNQYETGALAAFGQSYDPTWGRVKSITSPAVGNHEYMTPGAAGYFDYFNGTGNPSGPAGDRTKGYYSFDIGAWHLISLNSNCTEVGGCGAGSAQEQWLRQDLAASNHSCVLAYWHHPLFSSGRYSPGIATVRPLFQALYDYNADVLLTGHDHNYERFAPQDPNGVFNEARGIREFVVGTGGHSQYAQGAPIPNSEVRNSGSYGVLRLTLDSTSFAWQFTAEPGQTFADSGSDSCNGPPIPGNLPSSHVRPISASPIYVSLVPSFQECTAANRAHGPPLAYGSCTPPAMRSPNLTIRVPNGESRSKGFVRMAARLGPAGGPDDTDIRLRLSLSNVMRASDLSEYTGELRAGATVRLTDKETPVSSTVQDFPLEFDVPCTPTPDPADKSLCDVLTDVDAVIPGATPERTRAVWALDQIRVYDGGPDEDAGTEGDNSLFAVQGFFVP